MDDLQQAVEVIGRGEMVKTATLVPLLHEVTQLVPRVGVVHLPPCEGTGQTIVVGPLRGHAAELSHLLQLRWHNVVDMQSRFVFLGNTIDGGDHSCETIYLVALLLRVLGPARVVVLRGAQEHSFPTLASFLLGHHPTTLDAEVRVRELQPDALGLRDAIRSLFQVLPIGCVVDEKYFCVGSGIPSRCSTVGDIASASVSASLGNGSSDDDAAVHEAVWNEPMDDDDQYSLPGSVEYASSEEFEGSYNFSFQAACRFLTSNGLVCIVRGSHYTTDRSSEARNRCGRPWHYQHAPYDGGYRLHACHPHTAFPTIVTLFSAASYCDRNKNLCAFAVVGSGGLVVQQKDRCPTRPLQLPGSHRNAFSWSVPLLLKHAASAVRVMLTEPIDDTDAIMDAAVDEHQLQRMRLLAKLCLTNRKYPLPQLAL